MDSEKFAIIFHKNDRVKKIQCLRCGERSPLLSVGEGVEQWCASHECQLREKVSMAVNEKETGVSPEPQSVDTVDEDKDDLESIPEEASQDSDDEEEENED